MQVCETLLSVWETLLSVWEVLTTIQSPVYRGLFVIVEIDIEFILNLYKYKFHKKF